MVTLDSHEDMQRLVDSGVVAVMRGADADTILEVAQALHDGGVTAYEITADNPDAMDLISEVSASFSETEAIVGAGTVLDSETARASIMNGAEFVVGPSFDEGVVETCNRYGTIVAPGILTPTEAVDAYEAGADLVKVFPASVMGPKHLASIKGPLPQIPLMPTGGIGIDNVADYIEAGAVVVGAGSAIMDADAIEAGDFEAITETAREFTQVIEDARE
ncbi:2-keto-3-deoxy-phosphogluconate aldolase [Halogeometricum borinquense DSM 11551]|uniref:2-keto-3-deoxy-phosphogluconate aldolase n=2 Tax=Halogeometricum borinquense TaxID=60847 RepID=E4NQ01_HALBP|nr:bifunctional 4-hydroxy-2-oxoglutarate aldolase/2-dehydro-3-deoxy-phosphogluconate aldolase [Halogeometricum borinquense]ADQ67746.1 2-keto-3-deoxy-phosphogluconate aldolase [Halogeometricum borinquense DSM 11551]ELY23572.1 2-keto-3-deoxy-phosphogluconate aldolase [Halogeometricum borinquense DSM 11551]RYJ13315.1 bifunctional 4-hydroxy-2-oxoglutarate aldolase/2-dehydro-3-deoxy-phosphogluconate aldolase [Halogeometricum borinquense]